MSSSPAAKKPFAVVTNPDTVPKNLLGGVVAIGNFDGVHRGHRAILQEALNRAEAANVPALALTFEPHPRTFFKPDTPVARLTPAAMKAEILQNMGFDGVIQLDFTADLADQSADAFVTSILKDKLQISQSVTGFNFHFGKARQGSPEYLREAGKTHGFTVVIAEPEVDENGDVISSSRVRQALREGGLPLANGLLGYRYTLRARVQHGDKRGRLLGYPTANMSLGENAILKQGIYAVKVRIDGVLHDGVASYGRRPTFVDGKPLLEVFVFDFTGDLYDKTLDVGLVGYIRGELKFDSAEALIGQMDDDSAQARAMLASMRPLSPLDMKLYGATGQ
ncbi:bifunctional riboflavin kinase/FAD synthetase [Polycladidibacter hongkongensis]|uniref:bifunctional riboflavin kinase/FAD synthetase n=1 Tax=Polycladidibacter hongkongensis TaxID=1647556 RepID=UPI00082AE48D|nr:bifunctional riboflavin kinase/FAD synthetase [Pseudovibrio hongkongensis]